MSLGSTGGQKLVWTSHEATSSYRSWRQFMPLVPAQPPTSWLCVAAMGFSTYPLSDTQVVSV